MSGSYQSEEEQVEALKRWWAENGKSTVVGVVVAVAAVFGWQGYQKQQQAKVDVASVTYQNMVTAAFGANGQPDEKQIATAVHLAEGLKQDFPKTTYAQFAALYKARFAVEAGKLDDAEAELRWALERAQEPEIALQIKLRLARVLYARGELEAALEYLQQDNAEGYASGFEEVKGDIYHAQGQNELALSAYEKALELNRTAKIPVNNPLLQLKLQQLKSLLGSPAAEAAGA